MVIKKIYNNNVLLVLDKKTNKELVVTGCGIGFKKSKGDLVELDKIEKKFLIQDDSFEEKINDLSKNVSDEIFNLTSQIIEYSEKVLENDLDEYVYISLTDHIYFALKRYNENMVIKNELLTEIRKIYKKEYEIGSWAVNYINEKMNVNLDLNEAGFIAMHIINANQRKSFTESKLIMEIVNDALFTIKDFFDIEFIYEDINYDRLLTHLKFFARRLIDNKENNESKESELLNIIKIQYQNYYNCANKIKENLAKKYNYNSINEDEILYLTLHINRVMSVLNFNK